MLITRKFKKIVKTLTGLFIVDISGNPTEEIINKFKKTISKGEKLHSFLDLDYTHTSHHTLEVIYHTQDPQILDYLNKNSEEQQYLLALYACKSGYSPNIIKKNHLLEQKNHNGLKSYLLSAFTRGNRIDIYDIFLHPWKTEDNHTLQNITEELIKNNLKKNEKLRAEFVLQNLIIDKNIHAPYKNKTLFDRFISKIDGTKEKIGIIIDHSLSIHMETVELFRYIQVLSENKALISHPKLLQFFENAQRITNKNSNDTLFLRELEKAIVHFESSQLQHLNKKNNTVKIL